MLTHVVKGLLPSHKHKQKALRSGQSDGAGLRHFVQDKQQQIEFLLTTTNRRLSLRDCHTLINYPSFTPPFEFLVGNAGSNR